MKRLFLFQRTNKPAAKCTATISGYLCNGVARWVTSPILSESDPIRGALRPELRWTHYRFLLRVESEKARNWYLNEAAEQNWSTRALERQINSLYYERLLLSREKAPLIDEMLDRPAGTYA